MMYPYMILSDETEIVHSHLIEENGEKKVIVHFERPTEEGFDVARCELPSYRWLKIEIYDHVSKGKPIPNATKIWLTRSGGCILAGNGSHIPNKQLTELMEFISAQYFLICAVWKEHFATDSINYYC